MLKEFESELLDICNRISDLENMLDKAKFEEIDYSHGKSDKLTAAFEKILTDNVWW